MLTASGGDLRLRVISAHRHGSPYVSFYLLFLFSFFSFFQHFYVSVFIRFTTPLDYPSGNPFSANALIYFTRINRGSGTAGSLAAFAVT